MGDFQSKIHNLVDIFFREIKLINNNFLKNNHQSSPLIHKILLLILEEALLKNTSDIHLEPQNMEYILRYRIDGKMRNIYSFPLNIHPYFVSYLKVLTKLDIAEKRIPQDGSVLFKELNLQLRLSTMPTIFGEKIVIRLLPSERKILSLNEIGFLDKDLLKFKQMLYLASGLLVITGPVNSGKSTLLYSALDYLNKEDTNIVTIEDPVEIKIEGINQVQINEKANINYETILKSILRQDPNIIMIGEIRDNEVAKQAFNMALTGHLVLTTMHGKNSKTAITRLMSMGISPSILSTTLKGITAQRLLRRLCPHCKDKIPSNNHPDYHKYKILLEDIPEIYVAKGCKECDFNGFWGRVPIYEVLDIKKSLEAMILKGDMNGFYEEDKEFSTMLDDAKKKLQKGYTTLEEVWRALYGIYI